MFTTHPSSYVPLPQFPLLDSSSMLHDEEGNAIPSMFLLPELPVEEDSEGDDELSDEDLETVAGGVDPPPPPPVGLS